LGETGVTEERKAGTTPALSLHRTGFALDVTVFYWRTIVRDRAYQICNKLAELALRAGMDCRAGRATTFRPREAGEGDHWSSRSERTVVEGAPDSQLRCRCRTMTAMKCFACDVNADGKLVVGA
jgi:hypothetical protein